MQPDDQFAALAELYAKHSGRFGSDFSGASEVGHVELSTLGERLQAVARGLAAKAHPFDRKAGGDAEGMRRAHT